MKIRSGFVSNSSSSSFVVAVEPGQDEFTATFKISLRPVTDKACHTLSELQEAILGHWGYSELTIEQLIEEDGEYLKNIYEEGKKAIRDGKVVLIGTVSNEGWGDGPSNFLFANGFKGVQDVEVIQDARY